MKQQDITLLYDIIADLKKPSILSNFLFGCLFIPLCAITIIGLWFISIKLFTYLNKIFHLEIGFPIGFIFVIIWVIISAYIIQWMNHTLFKIIPPWNYKLIPQKYIPTINKIILARNNIDIPFEEIEYKNFSQFIQNIETYFIEITEFKKDIIQNITFSKWRNNYWNNFFKNEQKYSYKKLHAFKLYISFTLKNFSHNLELQKTQLKTISHTPVSDIEKRLELQIQEIKRFLEKI